MNDTIAGGIGVGLLIALALPAIALFMIWLGMFIDILITKSDVWMATGHDRWFNLLLVIGLGPVGAIIYGIFVRPQLTRMETKIAVGRARRANQWGKEPVPPAFQA